MLILWKGCPWPVFPTVLCFLLSSAAKIWSDLWGARSDLCTR